MAKIKMHTKEELLSGLEDALKAAKPKLYRQLKKEGALKEWLQSRGNLAWNEFVDMVEGNLDESMAWEKIVYNYMLNP